nr:helix-turn-helix transcriptional regulator [uncultured Flavobacterium sp.]
MIKQKLKNKRKSQKVSQEDMAYYMGITQSQYCRRENGITKISKTEWHKIATILKTTLIEIYEDDINNAYEIDSVYSDTFNQQLLKIKNEELTKHLQRLENENKDLKEELAQLEKIIMLSKTE